jgi:predicted acyltransferase
MGKEERMAPTPRLSSLDALRGFDMCWIIGLHSALNALIARYCPESEFGRFVSSQLEHVPWEGFHFYDLIFPLFIFLAGVSQSIALPRRIEREGTKAAVLHLLSRGLVLFLIGIFYSGGMTDGWEKIRWMGVLQRIALTTTIAGLLSLRLPTRGLVAFCAVLLVGYELPFHWIPVPETGATGFAQGANIANYLDSVLLPGRLHGKTWDPEGLLSTLPAIVTALLGLLAGRWLTSGRDPAKIVRGLLGAGALLVVAGWCWHPLFPVIKKLWTSSFVLVAAGWSAILLGIFYWLVDAKGYSAWTPPFVWVGSNPILLYVLSGMGLFIQIGTRFAGKSAAPLSWAAPVFAFAAMLLVAHWMYRQKIFVRV